MKFPDLVKFLQALRAYGKKVLGKKSPPKS
jgi:hypothetical protein